MLTPVAVKVKCADERKQQFHAFGKTELCEYTDAVCSRQKGSLLRQSVFVLRMCVIQNARSSGNDALATPTDRRTAGGNCRGCTARPQTVMQVAQQQIVGMLLRTRKA